MHTLPDSMPVGVPDGTQADGVGVGASVTRERSAADYSGAAAARHGRAGRHRIRINAQWRICFRWTDDGPCDVEIVDYH